MEDTSGRRGTSTRLCTWLRLRLGAASASALGGVGLESAFCESAYVYPRLEIVSTSESANTLTHTRSLGRGGEGEGVVIGRGVTKS